MIHTVKSFSRVNETEVDVFLRFSCFFYDPKWMCGVGREEKIYILCGKAERRDSDRLFGRVCREASEKKAWGETWYLLRAFQEEETGRAKALRLG